MALNFLRKPRLRDRDAVLNQHLRHVEIGADLEGDGQIIGAVAGAGRRHIKHPLDAVDLLLDRRGDGVGENPGVGPGVNGGHLNRRRRDVGILLDRQVEERDGSDEHGHDRDDIGQDRPLDEES